MRVIITYTVRLSRHVSSFFHFEWNLDVSLSQLNSWVKHRVGTRSIVTKRRIILSSPVRLHVVSRNPSAILAIGLLVLRLDRSWTSEESQLTVEKVFCCVRWTHRGHDSIKRVSCRNVVKRTPQAYPGVTTTSPPRRYFEKAYTPTILQSSLLLFINKDNLKLGGTTYPRKIVKLS